MFKKTLSTLAALTVVAMLVVASQANAGGNNSNHRVRAELGGAGLASGKADYRERMRQNTLEQRFSVEVEDAEPGTIMTVEINGVVFGMFVVNDLGIGELEYRTPQFNDDPGTLPIPDGFPQLVAGDVITVGTLSGVFENH